MAAPATGDDSPLVWLILVVLGVGVVFLLARAMRGPPAKNTKKSGRVGQSSKSGKPGSAKVGAKKR